VDVDPRSYNLDPDAIEAALSPRTRAILVVHQLGLPAALEPIERLARARGLVVVEDSACAVGSKLGGRCVGSSGNLGCFSFHPRKVLVTGEGGMITTGDAEQAARLRRLRHQGMSLSDLERHGADRVVTERYPEVGYNFRMSDLHAAVGLVQLGKLDGFLAQRRALAARYDAALVDFPEVEPPFVPEGAEPNHQSYIVRLAGADERGRNRVLDELTRRGVASRRGLMACHLEPPYREARRAGGLAHTERAAAQTLLLPVFDALTEDDQDFVLRALRESLRAAELAA
jgi:dTDP-4-amino-4,6-dideoxygalactose transaminase